VYSLVVSARRHECECTPLTSSGIRNAVTTQTLVVPIASSLFRFEPVCENTKNGQTLVTFLIRSGTFIQCQTPSLSVRPMHFTSTHTHTHTKRGDGGERQRERERGRKKTTIRIHLTRGGVGEKFLSVLSAERPIHPSDHRHFIGTPPAHTSGKAKPSLSLEQRRGNIHIDRDGHTTAIHTPISVNCTPSFLRPAMLCQKTASRPPLSVVCGVRVAGWLAVSLPACLSAPPRPVSVGSSRYMAECHRSNLPFVPPLCVFLL